MGSFSRTDSNTSSASRRTITGESQPTPEAPDTPSRRTRLFVQCLRKVKEHPLAARTARQPIGDGCGLEDLVRLVRPVFATDASLIPMVALRGAMTLLYQDTWQQRTDTPFVPTVEMLMGVGHIGDIASGDPTLGFAPETDRILSADQKEAALGIYSAVWYRLVNYEDYSRMSIDEVKQTALYPGRAVALDIIAWVATALCRAADQTELIATYPKPDRLEAPGWYTEPVFSKADRYWDGTDWTSRCRLRGHESLVPL